MTVNELRQKYLEFFKVRGHAIIPSASLIPENDPTVLFTTAGMHPLTPYLLGEKHPAGKRIVDVQKCIRTGDIDDVGDAWHLTFFEMLGNWSLGDYWKKEAIEWSFEFLTDKKYLGLSSERLAITVFAGDQDAPPDEESARIWQSLGISKERIFYLPKEENWWGPAGQTGPCGPCSEMFYDTGKKKCSEDCRPGCKCGKYAEIWNDVFMEYNKKIKNQKSKIKNGVGEIEYEYEFEQLKQKNVDTGMGVERTIAVLNGYDNVYETEVFSPLIQKIGEIGGAKYEGESIKAFRIIADHLKAAAFILTEGIEPSNVERGYVLRRLIRRAVRYGKLLGINEIFTFKVANVVVEMYREIYPELNSNRAFIEEQLVREEEKFAKVLDKLPEIEKELGGMLSWLDEETSASIVAGPIREYKVNRDRKEVYRDFGEKLFFFYQTKGFPLELSLEEIKKHRYLSPFFVEEVTKSFKEETSKHQTLSRAGAEQKFKGGLADTSEQTVKYHTAAHLLLSALREILGGEINQKGANITAERLRFDFSYLQKMTPEQIKQVEDFVNEKIQADLPVSMEEMSLEEAKARGATGVFESKYGERVKVYSVGGPSTSSGPPFSREICGGPHVERTGVLGKFKIIKEESSSAGVRRIKAILE